MFRPPLNRVELFDKSWQPRARNSAAQHGITGSHCAKELLVNPLLGRLCDHHGALVMYPLGRWASHERSCNCDLLDQIWERVFRRDRGRKPFMLLAMASRPNSLRTLVENTDVSAGRGQQYASPCGQHKHAKIHCGPVRRAVAPKKNKNTPPNRPSQKCFSRARLIDHD